MTENMKANYLQLLGMWFVIPALVSCSDDEIKDEAGNDPGDDMPEWYYAGGELGTSFLTTANALEQPSPAVENAGMYRQFKNGEALF